MISELANHLWQSTLFAFAAGLLALMCRKNRASVRYALWFTASVKFFVPFTLLMALGARMPWTSTAAQQITTPGVSATLAHVSRPFVERSIIEGATLQDIPRGIEWWTLVVIAVWLSGTLAIAIVRFRMWREIRGAVRGSAPWTVPGQPLPVGLETRATPGFVEPCVVGLWRPVLLVPARIEEDLTPGQLEAVLAHELCHIRRRDNLTAAVHMLAEAAFWFHPLVWWIGARLVDERERACDEDVVRRCGEPGVYAEGIVNVCKRYVEMPLTCVSRVSGANVRDRIVAIMTNRSIANLSVAQKMVLAGVGAVMVVAPMFAQSLPAPLTAGGRFEVASVKRNKGDSPMAMVLAPRILPGGSFAAVNVTLESVIRLAYGLQDFQIAGGPKWLTVDRFDIDARGPQGGAASDVPRRLQTLLAERFALKAHMETREQPIYALMLARADGSLGPRLRYSKYDPRQIQELEAKALLENTPATYAPPQCGLSADRRLGGCGTTLPLLASRLPMYVGRMVIDRTGLAGGYDYELKFSDRPVPGAGPGGGFPAALKIQSADPEAPSLFTALEEQLGLKLVRQTGRVEVLVIDHVEPPKPN